MSVSCPECDSPIDVDEYDMDIGDELTCAECGSLLRVANDAPVEVELADDDDDLEDALKKTDADGDDDDDDDDEDADDDSPDDE